MADSPLAVSPVDGRDHDSELLVDLVRTSRVTLLYAEEGSDKSHVLRSRVMPLLEAARGRQQTEVAVFFDAWNDEPLRALLARIREGVRALAPVAEPGDDAKDSSLAECLTALHEMHGITFFIVFDRFEDYLALPIERRSVREFKEALVEVMTQPHLPAHFLIALDQYAAPLLDGLRDRIPVLGNASVRLPPADAAIQDPSKTIKEHAQTGLHPARLPGAVPSAAFLEKRLAPDGSRRYGEPAKPREPDKSVEPAAPPSLLPEAAARLDVVLPKRSWHMQWVLLLVAALLAGVSYFMWPELRQLAERAREALQRAAPASPPGQEATKPDSKKPAAQDKTVSVPLDASPRKPGQVKPATEDNLRQETVPAMTHPPTTEPRPAPPLNAADTTAMVQPQTAPRGDAAAPKAVASAPSSSASPDVAPGAVLHIYVRDEAQRARAQALVRPLAERGIRVRGIELVAFGPSAPDLRYFRLEEQDEAAQIGRTLRNLGLPAQRLKRIPDFESRTALRQYELWLPLSLPEPPG